ncbi:unnamed protein product, partial [Lymnaea stagnalis]
SISIARCSSAHLCTDYLRNEYETISIQDKKSFKITLKVKIFSTSRGSRTKINKDWVIKENGNEIIRCTVLVYSKLKKVICKEELLDDTLNLACSNSPNYHPA